MTNISILITGYTALCIRQCTHFVLKDEEDISSVFEKELGLICIYESTKLSPGSRYIIFLAMTDVNFTRRQEKFFMKNKVMC